MAPDDARLDHGPEQEHRGGRPVVGPARGVLRDAAPELAEAHAQHTPVVLLELQVAVKRVHRLGELLEQLGVAPERAALARVRVEPAVRHVVHTRLQPRPDHAPDHLQLPAQPGVGVVDEWALLDGLADLVAGDLRVQRRPHQERGVGLRVCALRHALLADLLVGLDQCLVHVLAHPAEQVGRLEGDGLDGPALKCKRRGPPDRDRGVDGLAAVGRARLALAVPAALGVHVPTEPAVARARELGGVPDVHGLEVRAVGVGVPDALDNGAQPVVVQLLDARQRPVQGDALRALGADARQLEQLVLAPEADARADAVVVVVAEGDDGVEPVVAARELDDDQDVVLVDAGDRREPRRGHGQAERRALQEVGDRDGRRGQGQAGRQELTPCVRAHLGRVVVQRHE